MKTLVVNKNKKWLLKEPLYPYTPGVIYLKGDKERQAYENYIHMRWNREVEYTSEQGNFYQSHPNVEIKLIRNAYGPFYMIFFTNKKY